MLAHLQDYLDSTPANPAFEALPVQLCRDLTRLRELDAQGHACTQHAQQKMETLLNSTSTTEKTLLNSTAAEALLNSTTTTETLRELKALFATTIENTTNKLALASSAHETVMRHIARLDQDLEHLDDHQLPTAPPRFVQTTLQADKPRPQRNAQAQPIVPIVHSAVDTDHSDADKEREREPRDKEREREPRDKEREREPRERESKKDSFSLDNDVDPNEPTYCVCKQVSFGEMIAVF